jgi:tetratricopeptide (TPR) repeat protein
MIRNENNIGRALGQIAEDAGRYYVLAYQPANANFDGKYRPIQVRVKREGVRVRARRGYLALPPARMTVPKPISQLEQEQKDKEPESTPADAPNAPSPAAPIPPVDALPAAGKAVSEAADAPATNVRLRPDIEGRVRALSEREGGTREDLETRGWDAYQHGDIETAAALLSKAAAQPGAELWVHYALGMAQAGLGRPDDAIRSWEVVRKGAPDFEPVYMDLADTYAAKADLTTALAIVRDAQKRWPESAEVHSAIGVIHVRRGAVDEGIESLEKVIALTPDDPLAHLNLARAYALRFNRGRRYVESQRRWFAPEGDRQKALAAFRRCIDLGGPYAKQAAEERALLEWAK